MKSMKRNVIKNETWKGDGKVCAITITESNGTKQTIENVEAFAGIMRLKQEKGKLAGLLMGDRVELASLFTMREEIFDAALEETNDDVLLEMIEEAEKYLEKIIEEEEGENEGVCCHCKK